MDCLLYNLASQKYYPTKPSEYQDDLLNPDK